MQTAIDDETPRKAPATQSTSVPVATQQKKAWWLWVIPTIVILVTVGYILNSYENMKRKSETAIAQAQNLQHISETAVALAQSTTTAQAGAVMTQEYAKQISATALARPVINDSNLSEMTRLITLEDAVARVESNVVFSPDGSLVVAAVCVTKQEYDCVQMEIRIWQTFDGALVQKLDAPDPDNDSFLSFSPDGHMLALIHSYSKVQFWRVEDWQPTDTLELGDKSSWHMLAFSPDGSKLAIGDGQGNIQVWDIDIKSLLYEISVEDQIRSAMEEDRALAGTALTFSPDGTIIAMSTYEGEVKLLRASDGRIIQMLPLKGHNVWDLTFSPDGGLLAEAFSNWVVIWRVNDWTEQYKLYDHTDWVRRVVFSPDGRMLASGGEDKIIRFWEVDGGNLIFNLDEDYYIYALGFSPDGRSLMTAGWNEERGGSIYLWGITP